jgi:hypothetical protein
MPMNEYGPGELVPIAGPYEELNIFGTRTGRMVVVSEGEEFPSAPRGYRWRPLSDLSVAELRARAAQYRLMASTARTAQAANALRRLAERFDDLANQREREAGSRC